jgi:hypothetical protein
VRSHFLHLLLYSAIVAAFFSVLLRRGRAPQWKLLAAIWLSMVGGTLALAYLMYPFPR